MRSPFLLLPLLPAALATRPFLNEPDTGIEDVLGDTPAGTLPDLKEIVGLPDFEWAARHYMNSSSYTYYRNGAAGEWSYRNNLEVYGRFRFKPRMLVDVTNIESTLPTSILGHNFSAPFYISPCARGGLAHPDAEKNFVKAAYEENILYIPSLYASLSVDEIAAAKPSNGSQTIFQQVYLNDNDTETKQLFEHVEKLGSKAIVFTVDSAADGNRHRAARYGVGSADSSYTYITWDYYKKLQNMTSLPVILKGIQSVEDVKLAVQHGAPAVILSNHGGRQLDGTPSPIEVALEIHQEAPELFEQIEIYADGGVRYGADVLKLLALGVRAVGLGRPFMYSNTYGVEGVKRAIQLLKHEIAIDAGNLGVAHLKKIDASYVKWANNGWFS
ncbi:S-2-hydroxy-acid oxidase [Aspergillus alliaceus]|uniref:S-2-hydroxy-acid oxidase n=1 Tax=Petromyces alliaceus TaxID=209559 RepID=UPI0012A60712|nr:S-2-hydroxy-acid oxidase [Aspergillus alliaceus]KAB8236632.1 S-2-hydroxy-acid oxidase [Aspergillus alliaceus]